MRAVITGGAGFIGSSLADRMLAEGWHVTVIDSLTDYYSLPQKIANLTGLRGHRGCIIVHQDLATADLDALFGNADVVVHLAGQPGVRGSWAEGFEEYAQRNIVVTQRVLEGVRRNGVPRLVFASSSSIYGRAGNEPVRETDDARPYSPYGVTKLSCEHLCRTYADNFGTPSVLLRYFTVYGPRQRPDMAIHRIIESARTGVPFSIYGDGSQVRDFTYIDDVVAATFTAGERDLPPASTMNVCGGSTVTISAVCAIVGEMVGNAVPLVRIAGQPGDVQRTWGDPRIASELIGWTASTPFEEGLIRQVAWHATRRSE